MDTRTIHDPVNKRIVTQWKDGKVNYRLNSIKEGGRILLHVHNFDHLSECRFGKFLLNMIDLKGRLHSIIIEKGWQDIVPKGWQHSFYPMEYDGRLYEILCSWED